nr:DUF2190 family protein [Rhizobium sp.]
LSFARNLPVRSICLRTTRRRRSQLTLFGSQHGRNGYAALVRCPAVGPLCLQKPKRPHSAPYALTSDQGAKVGQLFGVATNDAALSADVALVYWDDTNKRCTTVATANLLIGVAAAAVAGGAGNTIGHVRLNASFRANDP